MVFVSAAAHASGTLRSGNDVLMKMKIDVAMSSCRMLHAVHRQTKLTLTKPLNVLRRSSSPAVHRQLPQQRSNSSVNHRSRNVWCHTKMSVRRPVSEFDARSGMFSYPGSIASDLSTS